MSNAIAVIGMACRYPGAANVGEFWENVLARRGSFRRLPPERIRVEDYLHPSDPDSFYIEDAAVLTDYTFDRAKYHIAGSTYRQTDMTHWLALDVASEALQDAGYGGAEGLPRALTSVVVGNTLTGEFSRAQTLRLRWPYVRRVLESCLTSQGLADEVRGSLMAEVEERYKAPFPEPNEESLAGGLANTIAGRICNYFDLGGGGYTMDGACASSLLALGNACSSLVAGDVEVAIAGGVDLSLDPFELIGFARNGALARDQMRVFDKQSNGFLPGEGCGFVVLMREEDARKSGRPIQALIKGWGVSSDGGGGLTRPSVGGQTLALQRAYDRADFGIESISYFEGHGTGTSVGDETELSTLVGALEGARDSDFVPALGSVKALIGHTKAASGIAGFIKAAKVVQRGIVPPTAGCPSPHALIASQETLRTPNSAEVWKGEGPMRAAVSGMGFGGINAHLVLEEAQGARRSSGFTVNERRALASWQDVEIFLFEEATEVELLEALTRFEDKAPQLSPGELVDFAADLALQRGKGAHRAAIVAHSPKALTKQLGQAIKQLREPQADSASAEGVWIGRGQVASKIAFLFPGQGTQVTCHGGLLTRRFDAARQVYVAAGLQGGAPTTDTARVQPAVVAASMAGVAVMDALGIPAEIAVGHSLGELSALAWAHSLSLDSVLGLARFRGEVMSTVQGPAGDMVAVYASPQEVSALLEAHGSEVGVACYNSPACTVVSGPRREVAAVVAGAGRLGYQTSQLAVSHAFHSSLMAGAQVALGEHLQTISLKAPVARVVSTVTGAETTTDTNLRGLLRDQLTSPVQFSKAIETASQEATLFIEVGSGQSMAGLSRQNVDTPVISIDVGSESVHGLLCAVAAAHVAGASIRSDVLFEDRLIRPVAEDWKLRCLANPCEQAPKVGIPVGAQVEQDTPVSSQASPEPEPEPGLSALQVLKTMIALRVELPVESIKDDSRMLTDLHLNSIMVSEIIVKGAKSLGVSPPAVPTEFANASVASIAEVLADGSASTAVVPVRGLDWVYPFRLDTMDATKPASRALDGPSDWVVSGPLDDLWTARLAADFGEAPGRGWVVRVPEDPGQEDRFRVLDLARTAGAKVQPGDRFALVHTGPGATSLAKTLKIEAPELEVSIIEVPAGRPEDTVADELKKWVQSTRGFSEVSLGHEVPQQPYWKRGHFESEWASPLQSGDLVLVTGGGKGITAECALGLAKRVSVRLAVVGRTRPEDSDELTDNLQRLRDVTEVQYFSVDVTDAQALQGVVRQIQADMGPIRGLLHGAGRNVPQTIADLDEGAMRETYAVKVQALQSLLALVDASALRLLVAFGSIIGRSGMRGEADYAVANEALTAVCEDYRSAHPNISCLSLEWSAWEGAGMAQRLGALEALMRQGVTPIPIDRGVELFCELIGRREYQGSTLITGRYGDLPTLSLGGASPDLPWLRFVDDVRTHTPGVEVVLETEISQLSDPYLLDHVFHGQVILPGVMAFEAMAQAGACLMGELERPSLHDVRFSRPIVVEDKTKVKLWVAAELKAPGEILAVVRSGEGAAQAECVRATLRYETSGAQGPARAIDAAQLRAPAQVYGGSLFHTGRFKRIEAFAQASARQSMGKLGIASKAPWFARQFAEKLLLGDPSTNDACIHTHQVCVPHRPLLPQSVKSISWAKNPSSIPTEIRTQEVDRTPTSIVVDVQLVDDAGQVQASWVGLRLGMVAGSVFDGPWTADLLGNVVTHTTEGVFGPGAGLVAAAIQDGQLSSSERRDLLVHQLFDGAKLSKRPDGRPEVEGPSAVSISHHDDWTLVTKGAGAWGCDLEGVAERAESTWSEMLGDEHMALAHRVAQECRLGLDSAATLVWSCREAIRKCDGGLRPHIEYSEKSPDGWLRFDSGDFVVAAAIVALADAPRPAALAVATLREFEVRL